MDEDLGVQVTVTRLRRRLSVESEDSTHSPSAPSTPTKKRGGRLVAKPQLELIDEASENVAKKTPRKSIARDVEPLEEKVLTPARRSARIRSNTSILAETNTPKATNSPRAKRAARRTSQLGSDNETPVAPVRQTRRTRKDSTTSVDIGENENEPPNNKQTGNIVKTTDDDIKKETADYTSSNDEFIIYIVTTRDIEDTSDTETVSNNNTNFTEEKDSGSPSPRKSPRLQNKKGRKSKKSINNSTASEDPQPSEEINNVTPEKTELNKSAKHLSVSVTKLSTDDSNGASIIKEVNVVDKDNETLKPTSVLQELNDNTGSPLNKSQQKQNTQTISAEDKVKDYNTSANKVNVLSHNNELNKSDTEILLEKAPGKIMKSIVLMEDSDSNSSKLIRDISDDQCVPVVENHFENNAPMNSEVEPMDIDETIPNNITINDFTDGNVSKEATVPTTNTETNISNLLNQNSILTVSYSKDMEIKPTSAESENIPKDLSFDGEKNITLNDSRNKSRRSTSVCIPLESDNVNKAIKQYQNKSKRKSSISALSDSITNLNQSSNKSQFSSPSNKEVIGLNTSSNKSQLNYSVQLDDGDSKKMSSSICSADQEEKSLNQSKRKSSLSDTNNSKQPQSPKYSDNDTSKNKSRNSSQLAMDTESNEVNIDSSKTIQDTTEKSNKSKRKSSLNKSQNKANLEENTTNDKNTSNATITQADSQNLEKSINENKSTLVLSQLKDMSTNDTKNESNNDISRSDFTTDAKNSKKNMTENYSTSTPLQQKSMQKLAMQINTSMISPSVINKSIDVKDKNNVSTALSSPSVTNKSVDVKDKKNVLAASSSSSVLNKSVDVKDKKNVSAASSDSSNSLDDEQEPAKDKSKMIDDEASEASDDYESGDSRDDEERQYEEENEIRENGETLESEQDFSNDSDYEKDSFIVSSDDEDNEMLSGTGDDLSLSDRELTMSKKSKKKFDERKRKEQKNASREMFEARHNISKEKSKNKKSKALESSDGESDDEAEKPKQQNRRRLDSSVSISKSDADESIGVKKKKVKRLSESACEEIGVAEKSQSEESFTHKKKKAKRLSESLRGETADANEKEISICDESAVNNKDPLLEAIKLEPKTPHKDFNISTVPIVDNMEEVQVDANMSVIDTNETSDPLQMTMAQSAEDEESLSSENAEIMDNYDSLLNNLNKQKKIKNLDVSLNIDKKSNANAKEPIIDQLNLTQTKAKKGKEIKKNKVKTKEEKDNSDSSDSIDMQLLFPEDSNDSETHSNKQNQSKKAIEPAEEYIPLKKTPGKTHIPVKIDTRASLNNSALNNSKSNNKQKSALLLEETENSSEPTDDGIKIFIDTTGTLDLDAEVANTGSSKKKKKKRLNKSGTNDSIAEDNNAQNVTATNIESEPPVEVMFKSDKKKKKKNKTFDEISITFTDTESNDTNKQNMSSSHFAEFNETENKVPLQTPKSEKKKKNKHNDLSIVEQSAGDDNNNSAKKSTVGVTENTELNTSHKSEKKKKKNKIIEGTVTANNDLNSTSFVESIGVMFEDVVDSSVSLNTSKKSDKKKKKNNDVSTIESNETETEIPSAEKTLSESMIDADNLVPEATDSNASLNTSKKSDKKKKKNKDVSTIESNETETEIPSAEKKLSESIIDADNLVPEVKDPNASLNTSKKPDKKKKKNKDISIIESNETETEIPSAENKLSESIIDADNLVTKTKDPNVSLNTSKKSDKKKKKNKDVSVLETNETEILSAEILLIESVIDAVNLVTETKGLSLKTKKKEKRSKNIDKNAIESKKAFENLIEDGQIIGSQIETASISDASAKSKKKKKKRRDNELVEQNTSKNAQVVDMNDDSNDAPEEVVFKFEKATAEEINEQKSKKRKLESENSQDAAPVISSKKKRKLAKAEATSNQEEVNQKTSKKRKRCDGAVEEQPQKVFKENSQDNIHVPRLPTSILDKLNEKPQPSKKPKAIATSNFIVEEARPRKNKPSTYLEQSVYLNDTPKKDNKKKHKNKKHPTVLPFIPTASTSDQGYTSQFKINVLPEDMQFVATSNGENFKNDLLNKQRIKKLGTFEKFKSQRSRKLCKF